MSGSKGDVYIIDDEEVVRQSTRLLLEVEGFVVRDFASGKTFLDEAGELTRGCILLDLHMPEMNGFKVLETLRARKADLPVIVVTGHGDDEIEKRLLKDGILRMLRKPVDPEDLINALLAAFGT